MKIEHATNEFGFSRATVTAFDTRSHMGLLECEGTEYTFPSSIYIAARDPGIGDTMWVLFEEGEVYRVYPASFYVAPPLELTDEC